MSEKRKNSKTGLSDFIKYRSDNLTGKEKNAFEKELQKDPFAEEAEEGFSSVEPGILAGDLKRLQERLRSRVASPRRFVIYRIAAAAALLLVISSLFFITQRNRNMMLPEEEKTLAVSAPDRQPSNAKEDTPARSITAQADDSGSGDKSKASRDRKKDAEKSRPDMAEADQISLAAPADKVRDELNVTERLMAEDAVTVKTDEEPETLLIRGRITSSEDNLAVPGASVVLKGTNITAITDTQGNFTISLPQVANPSLVANYIGMESKEVKVTGDSVIIVSLEPSKITAGEVAVTGYGEKRAISGISAGAAAKTEMKREMQSIGYTGPEPVGGTEEFNRYVEENIRRPLVHEESQKIVVVVSFIVRLSGIPDNLKVIRSPGTQYSEEAIRLIKEGPRWKPAAENGIPVEDEARVRIVFR